MLYNPTVTDTIRMIPMTVRKGVQKIYTEVARTYELVNHVLTLGLDIRWRKKAARAAAQMGGNLWLDVCSGTGEMARYLSILSDEGVNIFAVDFSFPMLKKVRDTGNIPNLNPVIAEAGILPFADASLDLVTISFATRNLNPRKEILESYLEEFNRVLKPGGHFVNLETSQPSTKIIRKLFHFYTKRIVKPLGWILSGSKAGYSYLSFTIPRFYAPDEFARILRQSGFSDVGFRRFLLGIAAMHVAKK
jgi:demethylmenaquinone methyltransferase/2-methoxy-6-polyprenyl-1,4-benzoquinol methylase